MIRSKSQHAESVDTLLGEVANEFFDRIARGEKPQVEEYARKHPEIAHLIREVFPTIDLVKDSAEAVHISREEPLDPKGKRQLGDFRILREIGRGGMGVVYEAEQISMGRMVALKVLPFVAIIGEKPVQRFKNEVRAVASLDHPNIVSVYSVGEERGVHYYAMQLIRGQKLTAVIEQLREQG